MSKVDDTFDFANSLVLEWGQDAVFVLPYFSVLPRSPKEEKNSCRMPVSARK